MRVSHRVRQILSDVRELNDEERAELEVELLASDATSARAWGEEIDRRAARAISGESSGLGRDDLRSLFAMPPAEARAHLAALLDART